VRRRERDGDEMGRRGEEEKEYRENRVEKESQRESPKEGNARR